ncbi:ATP-binding protein [Peribacillus butanolivorans]|uniref:ATP-binding protein n=1 Tax=Peribacillus butanolivorans TaxID=421767 RepID=UPI0035E15E20
MGMIFVGGIHGVGKSYFCNSFSREFEILHFSSSELISKQKKEQYSSNKMIKSVNKNQDFLLDALEILELTEEHFLLDGHFCLLNKEGKIIKIPEETFHKLNPNVIILLTDSVESIALRLIERDNREYDFDFLKRFQKEELEYATVISEKLDIPLHVYKMGNSLEILNRNLKSILKKEY